MMIARTIQELKDRLAGARASRRPSVGFVPTMGYLHEGHASLIKKARQENDVVVLSIFVNPLQFGPKEDYGRYPRDEARDLELARKLKVDHVFMPSPEEMYLDGAVAKVTLTGITDRLCGASRPGHFDGVATVVLKLLNIVGPDRAYFGLKDAQQVAVVERMCRDFNLPLAIVPCPIVREPDGLAMSSRNVYLSKEERNQAAVLFESLQAAAAAMRAEPEMTPSLLEERVLKQIRSAPLAEPEYVSLLSYPELESLPDAPISVLLNKKRLILALAVRFGQTRLIDNRIFE